MAINVMHINCRQYFRNIRPRALDFFSAVFYERRARQRDQFAVRGEVIRDIRLQTRMRLRQSFVNDKNRLAWRAIATAGKHLTQNWIRWIEDVIGEKDPMVPTDFN